MKKIIKIISLLLIMMIAMHTTSYGDDIDWFINALIDFSISDGTHQIMTDDKYETLNTQIRNAYYNDKASNLGDTAGDIVYNYIQKSKGGTTKISPADVKKGLEAIKKNIEKNPNTDDKKNILNYLNEMNGTNTTTSSSNEKQGGTSSGGTSSGGTSSGGTSSGGTSSGGTTSGGTTSAVTEIPKEAAWNLNLNGNLGQEPGGTTIPSRMQSLTNKILSIINTVGIIITVIVLTIIGIKYMIGSASEKAEYKKTLGPVVIGVFLLGAGTTVVNVLYKIGHG